MKYTEDMMRDIMRGTTNSVVIMEKNKKVLVQISEELFIVDFIKNDKAEMRLATSTSLKDSGVLNELLTFLNAEDNVKE